MRTLLEMHYNDLRYEKYLRKLQEGGQAKRKKRQSNYKVFKRACPA